MVSPDGILNARILVVDDQSVNALLLEQMLHGAGYTSVMTTTDPAAVSELYRKHRHDLILLDLLMPGMDGFQVMHALSDVETEGYLPVLVVTAEPSHKLRALEAGAKDFISKPFDRIEVLTRIHNMLEVRLLLREARSYAKVLERHDPLTGLPNRRLYRELLEKALARAAERKGIVSVLAVTVDRFTTVNDALGHAMGDALLCRVGDQLVGCIGPMDTVARLDGAAFGLIVATSAGDPESAAMIAPTVRTSVCAPLTTETGDLAVTLSIGIAVFPQDAPDADTLMRQAETALHAALDAGGNTNRFYSAQMDVRALKTLGVPSK